MDNQDNTLRLQLARQLVEHLEAGDDEQANLVLSQLSMKFERELFEEIGKLTRDLHDALKSSRNDSRLTEITRDEIPDAKERLNYVITMTEQATNRTLNAVDEGLPLAEELQSRVSVLQDDWMRLRKREMTLEQFRTYARELESFLASTGAQTERLRQLMSEIMMAQDFQDLTGQIIGRVIRVVQDVETHLVDLLRLSSGRLEVQSPPAEPPTPDQDAAAKLMQRGPAVPNTKDSQNDIVSGQDDVDDLLSSLGF